MPWPFYRNKRWFFVRRNTAQGPWAWHFALNAPRNVFSLGEWDKYRGGTDFCLGTTNEKCRHFLYFLTWNICIDTSKNQDLKESRLTLGCHCSWCRSQLSFVFQSRTHLKLGNHPLCGYGHRPKLQKVAVWAPSVLPNCKNCKNCKRERENRVEQLEQPKPKMKFHGW